MKGRRRACPSRQAAQPPPPLQPQRQHRQLAGRQTWLQASMEQMQMQKDSAPMGRQGLQLGRLPNRQAAMGVITIKAAKEKACSRAAGCLDPQRSFPGTLPRLQLTQSWRAARRSVLSMRRQHKPCLATANWRQGKALSRQPWRHAFIRGQSHSNLGPRWRTLPLPHSQLRSLCCSLAPQPRKGMH